MSDAVWQAGQIGPLSAAAPDRDGLDAPWPRGDRPGRSALAAFYRARAAGGAALIVTGGSAVSRVGAGGRNYSFIGEDADAPKLERVASAVHDAGGRVLLQLFHAGRYAFERSFGLTPVAPSAVYSSYSRCEPRALTDEEILETIEDFARGAARARELGFDGVEIMGSEGYLLEQFMAPLTNLRDDDWGGDAERRMRFPLAVARGGPRGERTGAGGRLPALRRRPDPRRRRARPMRWRWPAGSRASRRRPQRRDRLARGSRADGAGDGPEGRLDPLGTPVREAVEVPVIASNRINTV